MKLFFCVLLLGIGAQGQEVSNIFLNQIIHDRTVLDDVALSEIPDESAWGNQANGSCNMGQPVLVNPRAADETDGKLQRWGDGKIVWIDPSIEPHEPWTIATVPAEPVDVPAVQEQETYKTGDSNCKAAPECEGKAAWTCNIVICEDETKTRPITTCADKSRILEHDENSPPKYWCRKVQTQ